MKLKGKSKKTKQSNSGKKELANLKALYKKGELNFSSKKIAEEILKEFKKGLSH
ncbi:MAG: hypothetical protein HYY52_08870 [Candidatus Melainabacteria bacterium]|nr:hypothetical protein [Candidatus Melainabacteria bacterium]